MEPKLESKTDRDLLVIAVNDIKWIKDRSVENEASNAVAHAEIRRIAEASHKRIDKVIISIILTIIILAIGIITQIAKGA